MKKILGLTAIASLAYLGIHANYNGNAVGSYKGPNDAFPLITNHKLVQALVNTDTLTLTAPADYKDAVPTGVEVWGPANGAGLRTRITTLAITSHNVLTGVTVLTASGAVAIGAVVVVTYGQALA